MAKSKTTNPTPPQQIFVGFTSDGKAHIKKNLSDLKSLRNWHIGVYKLESVKKVTFNPTLEDVPTGG